MQCIVAQRLVRRLCHHCAKEYGPAMERLEQLGVSHDAALDERAVCYTAEGCDHCDGTGYRGRVGIHEAMVFSEAVRRMVLGDASVDVLRALAVTEGMISMRTDGIAKALQGTTTLEEVLAATDDAGRLPSTVVLP
jgi:type II secretory ATPase GspE/PulE/Tfp pilus assembly ATPase PilB-like protein